MSISLILIPAALAAAAAVSATGIAGAVSVGRGDRADGDGGGAVPVAVQTRMKDEGLLAAALADLGASTVSSVGGTLRATVDGVEIEMARNDDGIWAAHLERVDGHELTEAEAASVIERLDAAYATHVQRAVAERIRARADTAGFELVSETRDDEDTLTMVLNVKDHA
ncbi:hypothetical protein [Microbacterium dauci]|uniref:Uncharacterized protein n=1 Tax=Microbacterium dauci TaxID=3048008 RepID=A0ABT6ZCX8_9MICO|nr:hypothetical protein [Microbacterium sp. LX3-4]MDJ1114011.1 hypothetical protein [Microbacterium sp. LX3-4]